MELFFPTDSVPTRHLFPNLVHCRSRIMTIVTSLGSGNDEWSKSISMDFKEIKLPLTEIAITFLWAL